MIKKPTLMSLPSATLDACAGSPLACIDGQLSPMTPSPVPKLNLAKASSLSTNALHASLIARCTAQLERLFWRKCDITAETDKLQHYFKPDTSGVDLAAREQAVEKLIVNLSSVTCPLAIATKILSLDGSCHEIQIQPRFVTALDQYDLSTAEHKIQTTLATIHDLKVQIEERSGVPAVAQMLYCDSEDSDDSLEDDTTILDMMNTGSVRDGQTFFLVVDTENLYWRRHSLLFQSYATKLAHGYKSMRTLMRGTNPTEQQRRTMKFCKTCRRALAFLLEKRGVHKARSLEVLTKVEKHMVETIVPILDAVSKRFNELLDADGIGHQ